MYEKDKRNRITLRLTDEQFGYIKTQCDVLGVTPSDFLRMLVNACCFAGKNMFAPNGQNENDGVEVLGRENDKTTKHD